MNFHTGNKAKHSTVAHIPRGAEEEIQTRV